MPDEPETEEPAVEGTAVDEGAAGDTLPEDLDVTAYVGPYSFPDNKRRRIPGLLYLAMATGCFALWATHTGGDRVLVNTGFLVVAIFLFFVGWYQIVTAWPLVVRDGQALVSAAQVVDFPVGHASAQLGWRGLRSRPTWRILLYSSEDPPRQRALALVDAVDGAVLEHFVEANPEEWAKYDR
jgi:hypothetical protein